MFQGWKQARRTSGQVSAIWMDKKTDRSAVSVAVIKCVDFILSAEGSLGKVSDNKSDIR